MAQPLRRRATAVFTNVLIAVPLLIGGGALAWVNLAPRPENPAQAAFLVKAGDSLPPVVVHDAAAKEHPLRSLLTPGAPTAFLVVSPDCEHCHAQMALLAGMRGREPGLVPRIVLVSVGDPEPTADFRKRYPGWEVYEDANLAFQRRYDLRAVPALLLVDAGGVVRGARVSLQQEDRLRPLLDSIRPPG